MTCSVFVGCRAVDAGGDEAVALQERAVWDLLALFFLQAQQAQQGLVPQVRERRSQFNRSNL